jgi:autotransporter-associated beta strand protein
MNMKLDSLRRQNLRHITLAAAAVGLLLVTAAPAGAANDTWTGGGQDRFWKTPENWSGNIAPSASDLLFFGGTRNTATTNNFAADTAFNALTFNSPAGFFFLGGNEIGLSGNITNNQVVTAQTIGLPLLLNTTPTVSVVPNGVLTISGKISGPNGLAVTGGGTVNLNGANPFTGNLTVNNSSTVVIGADTNLGAGTLVLNNGTLSSTASFALNANRGIAVGPGWGGISVPSGLTLSYGGVMADNGGAGGLTKSGYGTLTLSGANTYSGGTSNTIGTLVLDFGQAGSPIGGIINSSSSLELGGGNAGGGAENVAQLIVNGGAAADVQNFNGTFATFGGSAIVATNRTGGTVNLGLGALSHSPGGTIAFVTPATANGHVTTTSPNVNGTLGGYALISGDKNAASTFTDTGHTLILGTNYAAVDGSGNIVNFSGYSNVTASSTVASQVAGSTEPNVAINDTSAASVVNIATDNAGTTSDLNAIRWTTSSGGFDSISIGAGNTLRLGQFGGIIRNGASTANAVYIGGPNSTPQAGSGTSGVGGIGTLTAGGPNINTPGEIVIVANNASETSGTTIFESTIADNGTGPVTVVKMGPGSIKLDGHNTFSGGLYLLQGRVQFTGSEIGSANPDGGGSGPIFVLPGAYLFPSGTAAVTNAMFVAGAGDAHEPLGAFRGGTYSGVVTLIGDASFGGNAILNGPIVGPFNVTLGSAATVNGGATLNNPANNWTGDTIMTARSNTGANTVTSGAANVIPNGFGYGNVTLQGFSTGTITWNLNGFDQTVNGLFSAGTDATTTIQNAAAGNATLTVGNNDQSGTFGGVIQDAGGVLALTKIGGGIQTLSGANAYSGATIVNGGALAVSGAGSLGSSASIAVNAGATLDVSGATSFAVSSPVQLTGGTLAGNGSVGALGMTNGALTLDLAPATVNVTAASLAVGGSSNVVNISSVNSVTGYPALFTLVQYAGALSGSMNFVIGATPNASTGGYVSNDVTHSRIVLVLTNGPAVLTWAGNDPTNPTFWDATTTNWIAFKGSANQGPSAFQTADPVNFDDTGLANSVNLVGVLQPGFLTVDNSSVNYTFNGTGALVGTASLVKNGTGSLTLLNTGGDSYKGGVTVNGGTVVFGANNSITGGVGISSGATVQVGMNTGAGSLPGGNVTDGGSLIFNRGANLAVANSISGAGTITKQDTGVLTLSGNNGTLTGPIGVQAGTLQAGNGNAFGTGQTTINSGAMLDVNGQTLNTTAVVTVSGSGINNQGAIINTGAASQNALLSVTLAGDTTFGGTNRWDIRGTSPQLLTSPAGSPYSITKVGPNFIGIVGANVDFGLLNIDIKQGTLDYEGATTGLGDANGALTVELGATFEMYNASSPLSKNIVLNGTATNDVLLCGNGAVSSISSPVTLNGVCLLDAASATMLTFNGTISGSGSVVKVGAGTNFIGGSSAATYTGNTTVSNGTLMVNGTLSSATTVVTNGILAGAGTVSGTVTVLGGTLSPGDSVGSPQATLTVGTLTLSNATVAVDLSVTPSGGNDLLASGNLNVLGTNTLQISPLSFMNVGDTYTLMTYTGTTLPSSATNQLRVTSLNALFAFAVVDPSTTPGAIQITVLKAEGNDLWTGAKSSAWDITTTNWTRNGTAANFNDGDVATFDDSSTVNNVNITGTRTNSGIIEQAGRAYTFSGTGSLTGPGGLDFEGSQLTIANSGTNTFTGPIYINFGNLFVGNGGTSGSLGTGNITNNNGALVFNRSDSSLVVPNVIRGAGALTNMGAGTVTLSGASAYTGPTIIAQGGLRVLNATAMGTAFGQVIVSNGATLDITNSVNLGTKPIQASGSGIGGNGAIINSANNGGFVAANFSQLTITTNLVFGGSGRLDFRASSATAQDASLNTTGGGPSVIKVGTNALQMAGVQIDPSLGDILVGGGTLGFQWQMPSLGDPTRTLSVSNAASIAFFDMSNAVSKVLFLNGGASVLAQHGTTNEFDGPATLNGTNTFNISSGTVMLFANEFSGPGGLTKIGPGTMILSLLQTNGGSEIFSGNTVVGQGTLTLVDTADLTNSPAIVLSNATVDVSARTDGTLTLGTARPQILAGGGVINGALVEKPNSIVNPGNGLAPAVLTVSNAATLNGSVIMNLKRGSGVTNDEMVASSITAAGSLTVTNLGVDLQTGDKFQLFSAAVSGFAPVTLPPSNASGSTTYQWRNDVAVDGSITVTSVTVLALTTNATITSATLSGTNLLIHGTNNNVPNTTGRFVVLTSTNIATSLGNWTPVFTNTFNAGVFDYTNPIVPGTPQQFIDVKVIP